MDPYDPYSYISETNPVVQVLVALLPLFLLVFVISLGRRFIADCKEYGLAKAATGWGWELAFFPVMIVAAKYLGWWTLGLVALWPFGPTHSRKRPATSDDQ